MLKVRVVALVLFVTTFLRTTALALNLQRRAVQRTRLNAGPQSKNNYPDDDDDGSVKTEPMFSMAYDPLENPSQATLERDLEDLLMQRSLRFLDSKLVGKNEMCYLVGLEDKSAKEEGFFSMEESLTELSELAGAAGLSVVGSTYQRVSRPNIEYFIGQGKTKDIQRALQKLKCTCVIFDVELTPSQQKNLELALNQQAKGSNNKAKTIKVIDRTALILDIFAQHAKTREGQLQVQLALLTYRLPRLTNMWTHLERQSAGAKGRSNGGVGLRGPGEKQLESDKRQMKSKISALNKLINSVRTHRARHRMRRKQLGVPVVALVGYTNSGKSTLLNSFTLGAGAAGGVFAADMLFATLDPTTRMIRVPGLKNPDLLLTDTVGFIQKLPTNLIAAFRATLEEISEADVLLHVTDISNDAWRKQEASVLTELAKMGLANKPVVTVWNKLDTVPETAQFLRFEAAKRSQTVAMSAKTGDGSEQLLHALEQALSSQMQLLACTLPYEYTPIMSTLHRLSVLETVTYSDSGIYVKGFVPRFLCEQIVTLSQADDDEEVDFPRDDLDMGDGEYDYADLDSWTDLDLDALDDAWETEGSPQFAKNEGAPRKRPVIIEWKGAATAESPAEDLITKKKRSYDGDFDSDAEIMSIATAAVDDEEDFALMDVDALIEKQRAGASVQVDIPTDVQQIDWKALGKGRHSAREKYTFGESEKK